MVKITDTPKITSNDGTLWTGMTNADAQEDNKIDTLFSFADKNKDCIIDEAEIKRYNGPILVVEKDDKSKQGFISDWQNVMEYCHKQVIEDGQTVIENPIEFYPGLKYEEVSEDDFKSMFEALDLNSDNELSSEELQKYHDYVTRKKEYDEKYFEIDNKNQIIKNKNATVDFIGGSAGMSVGIFAAVKGRRMLDKIMTDSKYVFVNRMAEGAGAFVGTGILVGLAILGITIAKKRFGKEFIPTEKQLEGEFADLKALDEQYKNVCAK